MKIKDLKINFRYLCGNIACLSVDSIDGESVHNDIENEEAIIIFNSLVGEKENCQTVKTLLKENQELKEKNEKEFADFIKFKREQYDKHLEEINKLIKKKQELRYQLEERNIEYFRLSKENNEYAIKLHKYKIQQKEFIKYLKNMLDDENDIFSVVRVKDVLQKYKEIVNSSEQN